MTISVESHDTQLKTSKTSSDLPKTSAKPNHSVINQTPSNSSLSEFLLGHAEFETSIFERAMNEKKFAHDVTVSEIMTKRSQTLAPSDTIKDALNLMSEFRLTTIPIVDRENRCVGILSKSDLTEMFMQEDSELANSIGADDFSLARMHRNIDTSDTRQVKELMTFDVTTVRSTQTIPKACQMMLKHQIHHLPVVDEHNTVVGIVSTFDIIKVMADETSFAAS